MAIKEIARVSYDCFGLLQVLSLLLRSLQLLPKPFHLQKELLFCFGGFFYLDPCLIVFESSIFELLGGFYYKGFAQ